MSKSKKIAYFEISSPSIFKKQGKNNVWMWDTPGNDDLFVRIRTQHIIAEFADVVALVFDLMESV